MLAPPPSGVTTSIRAGNLQTAGAGRPFAAQLTASVIDASGAPVAGIRVTFRVWSGSADFGGGAVATALTSATGVATAPVLTAGRAVGPVRVTALVPGQVAPAIYVLRVVEP